MWVIVLYFQSIDSILYWMHSNFINTKFHSVILTGHAVLVVGIVVVDDDAAAMCRWANSFRNNHVSTIKIFVMLARAIYQHFEFRNFIGLNMAIESISSIFQYFKHQPLFRFRWTRGGIYYAMPLVSIVRCVAHIGRKLFFFLCGFSRGLLLLLLVFCICLCSDVHTNNYIAHIVLYCT